MKDVEGWEVAKPAYSNPLRWRLHDSIESPYPADKGWRFNENYVTYAPEYNKNGDKTFWGGRKVYEPYRGEVTNKLNSYK
jgi:hypothetical protein